MGVGAGMGHRHRSRIGKRVKRVFGFINNPNKIDDALLANYYCYYCPLLPEVVVGAAAAQEQQEIPFSKLIKPK